MLWLFGAEAVTLYCVIRAYLSERRARILLFGTKTNTNTKIPILDKWSQSFTADATKLQKRSSKLIVAFLQRLVTLQSFEHTILAVMVRVKKESRKEQLAHEVDLCTPWPKRSCWQ